MASKRRKELEGFLQEVDAICAWQHKLQHSMLEGWIAGGRFFIVQRFNAGDGWELYIPANDSIKIEPTLASARLYVKGVPRG